VQATVQTHRAKVAEKLTELYTTGAVQTAVQTHKIDFKDCKATERGKQGRKKHWILSDNWDFSKSIPVENLLLFKGRKDIQERH
jgi:hypothetical protein